MGFFFIVIPVNILQDATVGVELNVQNLSSRGFGLTLIGGWGLLVSLTPIRRFLARCMNINTNSPVHTLALVFVGYIVGQSILAWSQGGIEGLATSAEPASVGLFLLSEALFAIAAFLGVGYLVRRSGNPLLQRLGLVKPDRRQLIYGTVIIGFLVVLQGIVGAVWTLLNPEQAEVLEDLNTILLADFDTFWEWLLIALAAGIGEELLFRGALQPVMGLGFTAAIFALVHFQYGFSPILIFVAILALILGLIRRYFNTTTAIYIHVGYDFVLGLFVLLASYFQELSV
jgi:membrane protease YdiL (CAAX protease family)